MNQQNDQNPKAGQSGRGGQQDNPQHSQTSPSGQPGSDTESGKVGMNSQGHLDANSDNNQPDDYAQTPQEAARKRAEQRMRGDQSMAAQEERKGDKDQPQQK